MPSPEEILRQLASLAEAERSLAVFWHLILATVVIVVLRARGAISRRFGVIASAAPMVSVGALALRAGNPFNGIVFLASALAFVLIGLTLSEAPPPHAPSWAVILGAASIGYAWVYPHFLVQPWAYYLADAPFGILPCPTLAGVLGFALVGDGYGSRAWSLLAAALGVFYALFGMLRLGVWLDAGLLIPAIAVATLGSMRHLRLATVLGAALMLAGCASDGFNKIYPGMTDAQVADTMGRGPNNTELFPDGYSAWYFDADHCLLLLNGKVVAKQETRKEATVKTSVGTAERVTRAQCLPPGVERAPRTSTTVHTPVGTVEQNPGG